MSEALTLAVYLIVCRETGEAVKFPGNEFVYDSPDDNSSAEGLADMSVWTATQDHTADQAFNHVNGDTFVWRYFLPQVGSYFGMKVVLREQTLFEHRGNANFSRSHPMSR